MSPIPSLAVWSSWPLHADALVAALQQVGEKPVAVGDPDDASGMLVAAVEAPDLVALVGRRAATGRQTIVWGGTLAAARVTALRDAGASAYVSALAMPRDLAEVVWRVRDGEGVPWHPELDDEAVLNGAALTRREREVAQVYLVTRADRSRAEVARSLGLSERTLKVHIARIRGKASHEGTATREGLHHALVTKGWLA